MLLVEEIVFTCLDVRGFSSLLLSDTVAGTVVALVLDWSNDFTSDFGRELGFDDDEASLVLDWLVTA